MRSLAPLPLALVALALVLPAAAQAAPARPDLRQSAPTVAGDRALTPGATLTVTDSVRNAGRRRVRGTQTHFMLSRDADASSDDVAIGSRVVPALKRGRRSRRTTILPVPAWLAPGAWTLIACADRRDIVRERRERDNCRAAILPLRVPFPPSPPPPPPPPPPPAQLRVEEPAPTPAPAPAPEPAPEGPACAADTGGDTVDGVRTISEEVVSAADALAAAPASAFDQMWADSRRGWSGGDGTFSVALPDGRVLWLFGDTFLGGVRADGTRDPATPMVNNSLVVQDGACLVTYVGGTPAEPRAFLVPGGASTSNTHYWPNQGVVSADGERLHTFWTLIQRTGPDPLDLVIRGTALATFSLPSLELQGGLQDLTSRDGRFYGAAIVEDAAHTYLFGVDDPTHRLHLARLPREQLDDDPAGAGGALEFWAGGGAGWSADIDASEPVLAANVSNQVSVVPRAGGLVLASQAFPLGSELLTWSAPSPQGEWESKGPIANWDAPEGSWTYNALLHPWSESPDEGGMLLSYNVNAAPGSPSEATYEDASLYRPRFERAQLPLPPPLP